MHSSNDRQICFKAAGGDNCCMCGGASGKMAKCDNCPRNFHLQCLEPPLSKYVCAKFNVFSLPLHFFSIASGFFLWIRASGFFCLHWMFFHILKISGFPEHHGLAQPAKEWVAVQMNVTWSWLKASGTNSDSRPGLCRHMECVPPRMRMVTPRVERSMHLVVLFEVTTSRHFDVTRMQIFHRCFLLKFSFRLLLIFVKIFGRQQLGERRAGERHAHARDSEDEVSRVRVKFAN